MYIFLNGKKTDIPTEIQTIQHLLQHYQLENRIVVVERNKDIIDKQEYDSLLLQKKDIIEIVHFVGGG